MQNSDVLLTLLRQKLAEQTSSTYRLFQAVDIDGDGLISICDFICYCERFSFPSGVLTEEQIRLWFKAYAKSTASNATRPGISLMKEPALDYNSFKHFFEDSIKSDVATQEELPSVTVDIVRRALVEFMHKLGYPIHKFYKACAYGSEFLYEHHLRNILDTKCNIHFSNTAWSTLWKQLKSDSRAQHMSLHELEILLQPIPEPDSMAKNPATDSPGSVAQESPPIKQIENPRNKISRECDYNEDTPENVAIIMLYLADRFSSTMSPRLLFGRIDRKRYNYLTIEDFIFAVRDLTDIELNEKLAHEIFKIVAMHAGDGSNHQLMSYKGFLKLLSCQEYLVPRGLPNRANSTAAMYCKRPLTPLIECALHAPQHGRRAIISVTAAERNTKASLSGVFGPDPSTQLISVPSTVPSNQSIHQASHRPKSAVLSSSTISSFVRPRTGDDQRYTTTTLNYAPFAISEQEQHKKSNGFVMTEDQIRTQVTHTEFTAFIQQVTKQLQIRGESLRSMLSEAFHNRKIISAKELLWFFRNRLGIAVSPLTILKTFKIGGNDTILIDDVLKKFKIRPSSACISSNRRKID